MINSTLTRPSVPQEHPLDPATGASAITQLRDRLNGVLRGKADVVEKVLVCLLANGHLLIEDKPGLGKTTLAKGLASAVGGRFARIQCTPDLLPSDVTGFSILNQQSMTFEFREGPVFADVLLADEINRATPRTQSALLEAMAERQVTVDAQCRRLSPQFFVIATQNPSEQHGTYPLPEAQLDRFAMKLSIGYPAPADEQLLLQSAIAGATARDDSTASIITTAQLGELQQLVAQTAVTPALHDYMVRVAQATRNHPHVSLGLSPRGLLLWQRAAQARAWLEQRTYVVADDLQDVAVPVLGVRLATEHDHAESLLEELIETIPLPEQRR